MPDTAPPTSPKPKRKRRLIKLTIAIMIALAIVVCVVQAVLWSDYPRQIGVRVAQNVTGLRVDIGKLTLTWSGATTIEDLNVALPLADAPFLTVPRIDAKHTSLLGILCTLNVAIDAARIDRPFVDVRQGKDGVWNLQNVLNQLATPGENAAKGGTTRLPNVDLRDAVVRVTLADGRTMNVADIDLVGQRDGALRYTVDAHAADLVKADGDISASGRWPHRAVVVVRPALLKAIEPLTGPPPSLVRVVSATLNWQGERTDTGVTGRLTIPEKTTQAGPVIASGVTRLTLDGGDVTASPEGLTVTVPGVPAVTLAGGDATLRGSTVTLAGVRTRFANGSARLDGTANIAKQRGSVTASWEQIAFPPGVVHQGRATLEAANVWPGRPWVKGDLSVLGQAAGGTFETQAVVSGDGPRWSDATYVVDVPLARYSRQSELRLQDLRATIHNTADTVELIGIRLPQTANGPATLDAHGLYHFAGPAKSAGFFTAVGRDFRFAKQQNLAFNVNAWADTDSVTLQNAHANLGTDAWANLVGQYVFDRPEPVGMQLDFDTDPALSLPLSNTLAVAGRASGSLKVYGTLEPTRVKVEGDVASRNLKVNDLLVGDADMRVRGLLRENDAELRTDRLRAFGGEGWFGVDFTYFAKELHAMAGFSGIELAEIGKAVGTDAISGTAAGNVDLFIPIGDLRKLYGTGQIDLARPAAKPILEARSLTVPITVGEGYVRLLPAAVQDKGGTAAVRALVSLNDPTQFRLGVDLNEWLTQLPLAEFSSLTSGRIDFPQVDIADKAVSGRVDVKSRFFANTRPIGDVGVKLKADGQRVTLETVDGRILNGSVYGQGTLDFNDLAQGRLQAGVVGLSLDQLAALDPRLTGVQGRLSATIDSHASDVDNPLGPVQVDILVKADRATYKGIDIGDSRIRVFADRTRVALADDPERPNYVTLAGGTARVWGRLSQVPAGEDGVSRTSAFASVRLDKLDTEQLNRLIDPDGKPVPGRLSGTITAFGNPADVKRLSGQGRLELTESDLANVGPLAALYNAMRLGFAPATPTGEGSVAFRVNAGRFDVTGLDYFNRGIYARGALTVDDVLNLKTSPLSGYMIGTYRPLKDLKLPFFGTLDGILDALQTSATTLRIDGTMENIKAVPASLKQVTGSLRNILVGEAQSQ